MQCNKKQRLMSESGQTVRLRTSKCFPVCPRKRTFDLAFMSTRPSFSRRLPARAREDRGDLERASTPVPSRGRHPRPNQNRLVPHEGSPRRTGRSVSRRPRRPLWLRVGGHLQRGRPPRELRRRPSRSRATRAPQLGRANNRLSFSRSVMPFSSTASCGFDSIEPTSPATARGGEWTAVQVGAILR